MRACQRKDTKEVMEIISFIISVARGAMDMDRRDLFVARFNPQIILENFGFRVTLQETRMLLRILTIYLIAARRNLLKGHKI